MNEQPAHLLATESGIRRFGAVLLCMDIWAHLTRAQRHALTHPDELPHTRVRTRLTELGYWDTDGITATGRAIATYGPITTNHRSDTKDQP